MSDDWFSLEDVRAISVERNLCHTIVISHSKNSLLIVKVNIPHWT